MKGIVLISHGEMAKGLADTCRFIMGSSLAQLEYCCLLMGESPESYGARLHKAITDADSGDGVYVFADLYGGTPCNQAIMQLNDGIELLAGVNLPILLEVMTARLSDDSADTEQIIEKARMNLLDVRKAIASVTAQEGDE